jgi:hypothetical protein
MPEFDVTSDLVENLEMHTFEFDDSDVVVDVKQAWGLPGVKSTVDLRYFEHTLHEESWGEDSILEAGHTEPHWSLALVADMSYPIIITREPNKDHYTVVDGRHRLLKAWLLGHQHINVKYIEYGDLVRETKVEL